MEKDKEGGGGEGEEGGKEVRSVGVSWSAKLVEINKQMRIDGVSYAMYADEEEDCGGDYKLSLHAEA